MYTNIYLVRHAQINYIPDEYSRPLSEKGVEDVKRLTELFRCYELSQALSSPYLRALNTIKGIAREKKLTIEFIDDFRERRVASSHIDDFDSFAQRQWNDFEFSLEGGESLIETQKRGVKAIYGLIDTYRGQNILIGTHGTILAVILNHFDRQYDYEFWKGMKMPDVFKLTFKDDVLDDVLHIEV